MFMWSANRAARRNVFCSPLPPSMIGIVGRSRGLFKAFSTRYQLPVNEGSSPRSIGPMICSASSSRSNRCVNVPNSYPYSWCSFPNHPAPMPRIARPPETTSRVVTVLASIAGFR